MVRILLKDFPGLKHIADKLEPNSTSAMIDDCLINEEEQGIAVWEAMDCASTLPSDPTETCPQLQMVSSYTAEVLTAVKHLSRKAHVGQSPILMEYGQLLFVWLSRD